MTWYTVLASTDDHECATMIAEYARNLGATVSIEPDSGLTVATPAEAALSPSIIVAEQTVPIAQRPHQVYGIFRDGTLGYVGMSVDADKRIQQHMKKATEAMEPFVQWLVDGKKAGDIVVEVIECADRAEAKKKEVLLIRKGKPLFNKNHSNGAHVQIRGSTTLLALEHGDEDRP
jgi:hypothetical protein